MNKTILNFSKPLVLLLMLGGGAFSHLSAQYCASSAYYIGYTEIDEVIFFGNSMNINRNTASICATYTDFTSSDTADVILGDTYNLSITTGKCSSTYYHRIHKVYIDWNQDQDFDDLGEEVFVSPYFAYGSSPVAVLNTVTVPVNALPGYTRMRIVVSETSNPAGIGPCSSYSYGETEDYTLKVTGYSNDIGIIALINPTFPTCVIDSVVKVSIMNNGSLPLSNATINWSVNGAVQSSYSYSPTTTLGSYAIDTINMGTLSGGFSDGDNLVVWASMANGISPDSNAFNDTLALTLNNALAGTYLINPSGAGDFVSFTNALTILNIYGVCGPVIFEAVNGTYYEQIELGSVAGVDSINTVTFRSQSGNAASVVVSYAATSSTDNFVINFNGASYFTIESLTMQAVDTAYARVLTTSITGENNHITINNCVLEGVPTTSGSYDMNVTYIYGQSNDNWTISNNTFLNGNSGLYFYGSWNGTNDDSNTIVGNSMINQYYSGIRINYQNNLILNNNYVKSNSIGAIGYAFYLYRINNGEISDNYVEGSTSWPLYGMYLSQVQGDLTTFFPVHNNRIYMPSSSASNGFQVTNNLFVEYAFNSVYMVGDSSTIGMSLSSGGYNIVKNNIVKVAGADATAYAINGSPIYQMDNNAFSAPNGYVGYKGTAQATLSDWVAATGFDSNSIELLNVYSDPSTLKVCTDSLYGAGVFSNIYVAPTTTDFEGEPRQNPPCIGADEFMPISEFGIDDQTLCNGDTLELTQYYFDTVVWNTVDTTNTISVTSIGSQSVAVYDACGSDTSNFNVIVPLIASVNNINLCEATTAVLETGIPNGSYLWNDGSTDSVFMVDSAQIVWVSVIDSFGCTSSDTAIITESINVNLPDSTIFCEGGSAELDAVMPGVYSWNTGDTTKSIFVSSTGYYSVTVIDQNCTSSDSVYVDEILNPIAAFCSQEDHMTVAFKNSSQNTTAYIWDFGDGTISWQGSPVHVYPYTGNGDNYYDVKLVVENQCSIDSVVHTVHVGYYGSPSKKISAHKNNTWTVNLHLVNAGSGSYLWDFDDGSTSTSSNPTHTYSSSNAYECYSIKLTYEDCFSKDYYKKIAVGNYPASNPCNIIDGVQNTQIAATRIEVYPNPNIGVFTIKIEQAVMGDLNIEVIDATGRVSLRKDFGNIQGNFSQEINLNDATPGIYFVRVILNNESAVYRIVVE